MNYVTAVFSESILLCSEWYNNTYYIGNTVRIKDIIFFRFQPKLHTGAPQQAAMMKALGQKTYLAQPEVSSDSNCRSFSTDGSTTYFGCLV